MKKTNKHTKTETIKITSEVKAKHVASKTVATGDHEPINATPIMSKATAT